MEEIIVARHSRTMKLHKGNIIPYGEYYVRHDNIMYTPENADGLRDKREFPSINLAKKRSREIMNKGGQVTTK
jgi:hypothetical protein